jgi:hypothetical protein
MQSQNSDYFHSGAVCKLHHTEVLTHPRVKRCFYFTTGVKHSSRRAERTPEAVAVSQAYCGHPAGVTFVAFLIPAGACKTNLSPSPWVSQREV